MRVSLPITMASCLVVIVLTWWLSTRSRDYLTAPSSAEIEQIRLTAAQTNPTAQGLGDALSPTSQQDNVSAPIPVVLPKHVSRAPRLDDYLDEAAYGADYLIELAGLLQNEHPERSLICWERVLDSSKASEAQARRAAEAIHKLKASTPIRNEDPQKAIPILIQAGTGPTAAAQLKPVLETMAELMKSRSSGLISATSKVSIGTEDMIEDGRSPVALWISGPNDSSPSTDVVSFFIPVNTSEDLTQRIQTETYRIIRHNISQMDNFQPPPKPSEQNSADKLLEGYITRLVWKYFGESLQK